MFFRLIMLIMVAIQVMFFVPGCEQVKEYRKKAYYNKARDLYGAQDYQAALKEAKFALEFDEDYFDAIVLRGKCQYELKDYSSAAFTFLQAAQVDGLSNELFLKSADAFFRAGIYPRSMSYTARVLATEPYNSQALCLDVRIRLRSRKLRFWREVEDIIQPVFDDPEHADEAFALLAEFNILNDDLEAAELILMEHVSLNDDWFFAMRMLANRYDSIDDPQAVVRIYSKVLELKPDSTDDLYSLLSVLRKSGRKEDEQKLLLSLIASEGQEVHYELELIRFYIHFGQFEEAEKLISAGIERGIRGVDFSRLLIEVYRKTNRLEVAIQVAKDVLSQLGDEAYEVEIEFMSILAWLYYERNNLDLAKAVVRWLLDLDSGNSSARFLLARLSIDEGRTLLAIAELRGLISEDIDNPDYDYYIGLAHMARSETGPAEQSFNSALKKEPSYKRALLQLAELYFEQEEFVELEHKVNEFLANSPDDRDVLALQTELFDKMMARSSLDSIPDTGMLQ